MAGRGSPPGKPIARLQGQDRQGHVTTSELLPTSCFLRRSVALWSCQKRLPMRFPTFFFRPASSPRSCFRLPWLIQTRRRETRLRRALTPLVLLAVRRSPDSGSSQLCRASIGKNNEISNREGNLNLGADRWRSNVCAVECIERDRGPGHVCTNANDRAKEADFFNLRRQVNVA